MPTPRHIHTGHRVNYLGMPLIFSLFHQASGSFATAPVAGQSPVEPARSVLSTGRAVMIGVVNSRVRNLPLELLPFVNSLRTVSLDSAVGLTYPPVTQFDPQGITEWISPADFAKQGRETSYRSDSVMSKTVFHDSKPSVTKTSRYCSNPSREKMAPNSVICAAVRKRSRTATNLCQLRRGPTSRLQLGPGKRERLEIHAPALLPICPVV